MACFLSEWRPLAEFAYFLSGILLLAGVGLAYSQLRAVKKDSALRITRVASEKAIEAADLYYSKYLPLANTFYLLRNQKNLGTYGGPIGNFSKESISTNELPAALARFGEMTWGDHLNQLELLSASLVSGVGDQEVAFSIIGRSFCSAVEEHYDIISLCRRHSSQPYFRYVVQLYGMWKGRLGEDTPAAQVKPVGASASITQDEHLPPLERRDG
jgi:hypothetical protein